MAEAVVIVMTFCIGLSNYSCASQLWVKIHTVFHIIVSTAGHDCQDALHLYTAITIALMMPNVAIDLHYYCRTFVQLWPASHKPKYTLLFLYLRREDDKARNHGKHTKRAQQTWLCCSKTTSRNRLAKYMPSCWLLRSVATAAPGYAWDRFDALFLCCLRLLRILCAHRTRFVPWPCRALDCVFDSDDDAEMLWWWWWWWCRANPHAAASVNGLNLCVDACASHRVLEYVHIAASSS